MKNFFLALCLAFHANAQVCTERIFTPYEKFILLDIYTISTGDRSFIRDKGVFIIREDTMPNSDLLWEITMLYDDSEIKINTPTVYGYVVNVPVLFANKEIDHDGQRWECLKPKLYDWLF